MNEILLLSAGASSGLVRALKPEFEQREGCRVSGEFGAVGAMKERLLSGVPCDVVISSRKVMESLLHDEWVTQDSVKPLGNVSTAIAVINGGPRPSIMDAASLARALKNATGIYLPDMKRATAGIHMRKIFEELGILDTICDRLREYKSGAVAMQAMADNADPHSLGCTQATEILYTQGVELVGALPREIGLDTLYEAGITTQTVRGPLAARFVECITDQTGLDARRAAGFY